MVKILAVGDPHGSEKIKKIPNKGFDFILLTGDLGKADFARKFHFDNFKRKQQGLKEKEYTKKETKAVYKEIADSTVDVAKYFLRYSPTYSILGNVGTTMIINSEVKKRGE
jgi:Icc-related predicted phosphoesterase